MSAVEIVRGAAIAAGALATLAPWLLRAIGLTSTPVHGDLWVSLPLFVVAAGIAAASRPLSRGAAGVTRVLGALAIAVAAIDAPAIVERIGAAGDSHVAAWLAAEARVHLGCYAVVATAGLALLLAPVSGRTRPAPRS